MSMTITYELGNSLYINITNRCTNRCSFCIRNFTDGLSRQNLWLEREPTVEEVMADIDKRNLTKYRELVFCGYGEPMMRTDDLLEICKRLKERYHVSIRVNTNGHANLIYGQDITPRLAGLVDAVSISLNAKNAQAYQEICQSEFGEGAYEAVLDFAARVQKYVPIVVLSVVGVIPEEDIMVCEEIARRIGAEFRVR